MIIGVMMVYFQLKSIKNTLYHIIKYKNKSSTIVGFNTYNLQGINR